MQLNELTPEMEGVIPQTDCRLRPDIRAMENGNIGKHVLAADQNRFCGSGQTLSIVVQDLTPTKPRVGKC